MIPMTFRSRSGSGQCERGLCASGASESSYPTMRLDKASTLFVLGRQGDWLKIKPPSGSFCYVAKSYIDLSKEDQKVGRTTTTLYVRMGSALNQLKTSVAMHLPVGKRSKSSAKTMSIGRSNRHWSGAIHQQSQRRLWTLNLICDTGVPLVRVWRLQKISVSICSMHRRDARVTRELSRSFLQIVRQDLRRVKLWRGVGDGDRQDSNALVAWQRQRRRSRRDRNRVAEQIRVCVRFV